MADIELPETTPASVGTPDSGRARIFISDVTGQLATVDDTGTTTNYNASLGDGDKGDITVSGTGTVWTVDNGAITLAKMATAAKTEAWAVACSDETTALTTGTAKLTFCNPYDGVFNVTGVKASLSTAQASGSTFTVDINEAGTSILSTKLTIDNTEKTSTTAATAAVISDASIAANAEITIDIDTVGDGTAKGLKVYILGYPS